MEIPERVHYRRASSLQVACMTCSYFQAGRCSMFNAEVNPDYVCDEWEAIEADHSFSQAFTDDAAGTPTMVAVYPRMEEAAQIAQDDGDAPGDLHTTLAFLGRTSGPLTAVRDALAPVAEIHAPMVGQVGGVGVFGDNGDGHPHIALPSVPGLVELRVHATQALHDAGIEYGRNWGFQPHITLGYQPEAALPAMTMVGQPLNFDDLWIVRGDTERIRLPLAGEKPVTADASTAEALRAVAEEVKPDGGYGDTFWNTDVGAVFWVCGDWTSNDESDAARAAFLAVPGVRSFDYEAEGWSKTHEAAPWVRVWPGPLIAAARPVPAVSRVPAGAHNEVLLRAYKRADELEPRLARILEPILAQAGDQAADAFERMATNHLTAAGKWSPPAPNEILNVGALASALRARTEKTRQAIIESVMKPVLEQAGIAYDVTNPLTARVLAQSASQVVHIAQTTQLNVMRAVRQGYEKGLTIPDTARVIRAGMQEASVARSTLIARTELAGAVNGGSLAATQIVGDATGVTYLKEWLTAPGAPHPRHEDYDGLDGQTVALDATFTVGEDQLQFPGDPDGDPSEVCNCRCALVYTDQAGDATDAPEGVDESG